MNRTDVEELIAKTIDAESEIGTPWWPGNEMAPIVFRRWSSFARRHRKLKNTKLEERVMDLAKGLRDHFEPDVPYTHLSEWLHLSGILCRILEGQSI